MCQSIFVLIRIRAVSVFTLLFACAKLCWHIGSDAQIYLV